MKGKRFENVLALVREERVLGLAGLSSVLCLLFGHGLMQGLANPVVLTCVSGWLIGVVVLSVIAVVRHADQLALRLGEPFGTLILTLVVTAIEVITISTMMFHGENNPTLVRDTLFAVIMIILNGMVGLSLLVGGWRHREQHFNLLGANAYLCVIIPLAVLSLMLPNFTVSTAGPTLSSVQEIFLAVMSLGLYGIFLVIQTNRHRMYFVLGEQPETAAGHPARSSRPLAAHVVLLGAYMAPVVFLTEQLAQPIDYLIEVAHAPAALGGAIIAMMVATPEAISAMQAARANQLQRSMNIFLGSVLATISLTVPTMLVISHVSGKKITLGLEHSDLLLLPLTLVLSVVTFASGRTNVLQGAVHALLFVVYLVLLFES